MVEKWNSWDIRILNTMLQCYIGIIIHAYILLCSFFVKEWPSIFPLINHRLTNFFIICLNPQCSSYTSSIHNRLSNYRGPASNYSLLPHFWHTYPDNWPAYPTYPKRTSIGHWLHINLGVIQTSIAIFRVRPKSIMGAPRPNAHIFFQNQWWVLTCPGIKSSAREYDGRLQFGQKLSRGGPLRWSCRVFTDIFSESRLRHQPG